MAGLPYDIVLDIFSRLQAKKVVQLRTLNRNICAASRSRHFGISQSNHAHADVGVLVRHNCGRKDIILCDNNCGVPSSFLRSLHKDKKEILGGGGGLVVFLEVMGPHTFDLLYNWTWSIFLCNPVLQQMIPLGRPPRKHRDDNGYGGAAVLCGQGDHPDVVYMRPTPAWDPHAELWRYSSFKKSWTLVNGLVDTGTRNVKLDRLILGSDGFIYLISDNGVAFLTEPYIVSINVCDGSSKILELPKEVRSPSNEWNIELGGPGRNSFLSLVLCNRATEFVIWDIKDGDRWVWERRGMTASMASMRLEPKPVRNFCLLNGSSLVIAVDGKIFAYKLNDGDEGLKRVRHTKRGLPYMCPYANTLRPCE